MSATLIIYVLLLVYILICALGNFIVPKYLSEDGRMYLLIIVGLIAANINAYNGAIRQTITWELLIGYWVWRYYKVNVKKELGPNKHNDFHAMDGDKQ